MPPRPARPRPALTVPAGTPREEIERLGVLHSLAALGEGICPACGEDLRPAVGDSQQTPGAGRLRLYCRSCPCYWQADHEAQEVTWEALGS
ncbi:hypothetical protein [Streptosporangium sp. NPDC002524]|uniref:hypothetical protein n=1 Tax=Streptosporangium sp. NPDC002524 TaxID=3154537 RepID=UPI0033261511